MAQPNLIDRLVGYFSPEQGLRRIAARNALGSYNATKRTRHKRDRNTSGGSGDEQTDRWTLWELREICRELDRNNGMSVGIIDRAVENILGPEGVAVDPLTEDDALNDLITEDWGEWLANDCDISGNLHGHQLFKKLLRAQYVDGDTFCQWDPEGRHGRGSLRPFEGDRVLNPTGAVAANGLPMVNGIAVDPTSGAERYYFVTHDHPTNGSVSVRDGITVSGDQVIKFANPRRISQRRGVPIMAPVIQEFDDVDDLLLFERLGAKLVAAMGFTVETDDPLGVAEALRLESGSNPGDKIESIDPGSVHYLKPGQKMTSVQSNRPSNNFDKFVQLLIRFVGLPLGMPIELVLLDFSQVNFSASRQLLHLAQLHFRSEQFELGCALSKVYRLWLADRIADGTYPSIPTIFRHEWGFPGWPSPNPEEDAKATALGLQLKIDNRHDACRRWGASFKRCLKQLKKEQAMIIDAGLDPTLPTVGNQAGQSQAPSGGTQP
jgi:lambda family phage portal protein